MKLSQGSKANGAFILTASHNPGGPNEVHALITFSFPEHHGHFLIHTAWLSSIMKSEYLPFNKILTGI